jgi:hypothetical protein
MKLSPLTIFIIALSLSIAVLSYAFIKEWMPNQTEAGYQREYAEKLIAEANKMKQAEKRVEKAIQVVQETAKKWQDVVAVKTPPRGLANGGIDLGVNRWQLTVDARRFRDSMQRALNAQLRRGGVTVVSGPQIPFPSESATNIVETYFNYPAIAFPVVMFDLGAITVQGNWRQIEQHVRSWSTMPNYMAVTDGLRLEGTSPALTATYNLSLVGFIREDRVFPPVPEGAPGPGGAVGGGAGPAPRGAL